MSHKDYVKFAAVLAEVRGRDQSENTPHGAIDDIEAGIADIFAADNYAFDRARFHAAALGQPLTGRDRPR